jgi:hypothetical protein
MFPDYYTGHKDRISEIFDFQSDEFLVSVVDIYSIRTINRAYD